MRFSEAFGVSRRAGDDWFDPHLSVDTKLFIDPLLIYLDRTEDWAGAHDELLAHFVHCYELVARGGRPDSAQARVARRLLTFPEPAEFCLGYTTAGTRGLGAGDRYAAVMADGIAVAIAAGLREPEHIEEIGILNEGIGADRISDAVCNVLKQRLISYTQGIARRHGIEMARHRVRNAEVHFNQGRWLDREVELPTSSMSGGPVILVPSRFLGELPILNANDWFDSHLNQDLRDQLNLGMSERVRKADIVRFARSRPQSVRQWAREQTSRRDLHGYDFSDDPLGVVHWDGPPKQYAAEHPIAGIDAVNNQDDLRRLLEQVLEQFKHFIEDQPGWRLLWNDNGTEKPEEAAQLALLGMAQSYLRQFDIEMDREVELGRGPVDFKLARGTSCRMVVELKKAHNGQFWLGLERQLPIYMRSDDSPEGWFVAIRYRSNQQSAIRMRELPRRVQAVAEASGRDIRYKAIDGRPQLSASHVR